MKIAFAALLALTSLASSPAARAATSKPRALFALIIGVNKSLDKKQAPLRYADDDAARFFDLFRMLGARTYVLSRLDKNTRRLHPQAAAEALAPTRALLGRTAKKLHAEVARARRRGLAPVLYIVYAGHGNVTKSGRGYVTLEDGRLTGDTLDKTLLAGARGASVHLIIDACYSYYLAFGRGPGGQRRPLRGFSQIPSVRDGRVGVLLSTSSAKRSHEWEAYQSGVFSHEVRSGLFGAADASGDGRVTYRELAAFIDRANESIPNARFRPRLYARPPKGASGRDAVLLDLSTQHRKSAIVVDAARAGRYMLEDDNGVRLADFHTGPGRAVRLLRPLRRRLFLRRVGKASEFAIPPGFGVLAVSKLAAQKPRVRSRGAAHHAFTRLFELPYDQSIATRYRFPAPPSAAELGGLARPPVLTATDIALGDDGAARRDRLRRVLGLSGIGLATAALVSAISLTVSANAISNDAPAGEAQQQVAERNRRIRARNIAAGVLYGVAGAATVAGVLLLFWPNTASSRPPRPPAQSISSRRRSRPRPRACTQA